MNQVVDKAGLADDALAEAFAADMARMLAALPQRPALRRALAGGQ